MRFLKVNTVLYLFSLIGDAIDYLLINILWLIRKIFRKDTNDDLRIKIKEPVKSIEFEKREGNILVKPSSEIEIKKKEAEIKDIVAETQEKIKKIDEEQKMDNGVEQVVVSNASEDNVAKKKSRRRRKISDQVKDIEKEWRSSIILLIVSISFVFSSCATLGASNDLTSEEKVTVSDQMISLEIERPKKYEPVSAELEKMETEAPKFIYLRLRGEDLYEECNEDDAEFVALDSDGLSNLERTLIIKNAYKDALKRTESLINLERERSNFLIDLISLEEKLRKMYIQENERVSKRLEKERKLWLFERIVDKVLLSIALIF